MGGAVEVADGKTAAGNTDWKAEGGLLTWVEDGVVGGVRGAAGLTGGEEEAHDSLVLVGILGLRQGLASSSLLLSSPSFRRASILTL